MTSDSDATPGPSVSPPLIVGIVIVCAFVAITIAASIFRFCRQKRSRGDGGGANFDENSSEVDLFNPNTVRSTSQVARMKEVRWINNMYAWERGRHAKLEVGELRPTTMMFKGANTRRGEARGWDEWSVWEDREGMANPTGEHSGATYFYNVDDPYAISSQHRLSQAASVLLPPHPANGRHNNNNSSSSSNKNNNQGWRDSRFRHSFVPMSSPMAQGQENRGHCRGRGGGGAGGHGRQQDGGEDDETARSDVAVIVADHDSPTPQGKGKGKSVAIINDSGDNMEDLAAGLGVGLGLGPGLGHGAGYQEAAAQHAVTENGNHRAQAQAHTPQQSQDQQQQTYSQPLCLGPQPSPKDGKGKMRASALPPQSQFLSPPPVRR